MTEQEPLIFGATNHHPAGCGTPPSLAGLASAAYRGYFENRYGEQAIFIYDDVRRLGHALSGGGWAGSRRGARARRASLAARLLACGAGSRPAVTRRHEGERRLPGKRRTERGW